MKRFSWLVMLAACGSSHSPAADAPGGGGDDDALDAPADTAPDTTPPPTYIERSGTRIKLTWAVTPDGVHQQLSNIVNYYDSLLQTTCDAQAWSDGMTRCTPRARTAAVYADAACTQPITVKTNGALPAYVMEYAVDSSGTLIISRLSTPGPATTDRTYYRRTNGVCDSNAPVGVPSTESAYSLVEVTGLVTLTIQHVGTNRVQGTWVSGSDGLDVVVDGRAFDTTLGVDCVLHPSQGSVCSITSRAPSSFADSQCSTPIANVTGAVAPVYLRASSCTNGDTRVFSPGTAHTPPVFAGTSSNCFQQTVSSPSWAEVGAQVGTLAPLTLVEDTAATTRLHPYHFAELAETPTGAFRDSLLGLDCSLTATGCIPPSETSVTRYTNAQCTTSVEVFQGYNDPTCGASPHLAYARMNATSPYHHIGAAHAGTLWVKDGSGCHDTALVESGSLYYDLDATAIAASSLETATTYTDP